MNQKSAVPPFDPEAFGARLRTAREAAGMTQGDLAKRVGAQVSGVSDWENGYRVPNSPRMLVALAHVLKRSVDELLMGRSGPMTALEAADYEQGRVDALRTIRRLVEAEMTTPTLPVEGGGGVSEGPTTSGTEKAGGKADGGKTRRRGTG